MEKLETMVLNLNMKICSKVLDHFSRKMYTQRSISYSFSWYGTPLSPGEEPML